MTPTTIGLIILAAAVFADTAAIIRHSTHIQDLWRDSTHHWEDSERIWKQFGKHWRNPAGLWREIGPGGPALNSPGPTRTPGRTAPPTSPGSDAANPDARTSEGRGDAPPGRGPA